MSENINDIFLIYTTHTNNTQRRLQSILDITQSQDNIMASLMNIIIQNYTNNAANNTANNAANNAANINPLAPTHASMGNDIDRLNNIINRRNVINRPFTQQENRFNHQRDVPLFNFPRVTNNAQNRWNGVLNSTNNREFQEEFLRPVTIRPTIHQINRATRVVVYNTIVNPSNTRCPISLLPFEEEDEVIQVLECGHIFVRDELMNWFNQNVRCPLCRYDVRNYIPRRNEQVDSLYTPVNLDSTGSFSSDSTNSAPITPRNNVPIQYTQANEIRQLHSPSTPTSPLANNVPSSLYNEEFIINAINNDPELQQMVTNIQNTLLSTVNNTHTSLDTRITAELGFIDTQGRYNAVTTSAPNNTTTTTHNNTANTTPITSTTSATSATPATSATSATPATPATSNISDTSTNPATPDTSTNPVTPDTPTTPNNNN